MDNLLNATIVAPKNALVAAEKSGLDMTALRTSFSGGTVGVLRALGNLANSPATAVQEGARTSLVREVLREVLSSKVWQERGLELPEKLHVASGGFTWIVKVLLGEAELALSVPKGQAEDYDERLKTRVAMSRLVPGGIGFEIPRVVGTYEEPFHACLMSFIQGGNCYALAFNDAGNPTLEERAGVGGNAVFEKLGFMAAGFSIVITYNSAFYIT